MKESRTQGEAATKQPNQKKKYAKMVNGK